MRCARHSVACPRLLLLAHLVLAVAASAQTEDTIGIWFDRQATVDVAHTSEPWAVVTAYVILRHPQPCTLIDGWECIVEIATDGPEPFVDWELPGTSLNWDVPPRFLVGIPGGLPAHDLVVLATARIQVPEAGQKLTLYVHPMDPPTLTDPPGYPLWLPAFSHVFPQEISPLIQSSGCESLPVAWINHKTPGELPNLSGPERVCFNGDQTSPAYQIRTVMVVHDSEVSVVGQVDIEGPGYSYRNSGGYVTEADTWFHLGPDEHLILQVYFENVPAQDQIGGLTLSVCGEMAFTCALADTCWHPLVWSPESLDFGEIAVGFSSDLTARVINDGLEAHEVQLRLEQPEGHFSLEDSSSFTLAPGDWWLVTVIYSPTSVGDHTAVLTTVDPGPELQCSGSAIPFLCDFEAPQGTDFGNVAMSDTLSLPFLIINHEDEPFVGLLGLTGPDYSSFTITQGGGYFDIAPGDTLDIEVAFHPAAPDSYQAVLASGMACGSLPLSGLCQLSGWWLIADSSDFGPVAVGDTLVHSFGVRNVEDHAVSGEIALTEPETDFFVSSGGGVFTVAPGDTHWVDVAFAPARLDSQQNAIASGIGMFPPLPISGVGDVAANWLTPAGTEFGQVAVGDTVILEFGLAGIAERPIRGEVGLVGPGADFQIVAGGGPFVLGPTSPSRHWVRVAFAPRRFGLQQAGIQVGTYVPTLPMSGTGSSAGEWLRPDGEYYGGVALGDTVTHAFGFRSLAQNVISEEIVLREDGTDFFFQSGGGSVTVAPGDTHWVHLAFTPGAIGLQQNAIFLSADAAAQSVSGHAVVLNPDCLVSAEELEFLAYSHWGNDPQPEQMVQITNAGPDTLSGVASIPDGRRIFTLSGGGTFVVAPDSAHQITVLYEPTEPGFDLANLYLGSCGCTDVALSGTAYQYPEGGEIGLYFDSDFTTNELVLSEPTEVRIYVVLRPGPGPIPPWSLVSRWWLSIREVPAPGVWVGATYHGSGAHNSLTVPDFDVETEMGMGGETLLATLTYLPLADTTLEVYSPEFGVGPLSWPSAHVEVFMFENWFIMTSDLGHAVAWIEIIEPAAAPLAEVSPGRVTLTWSVDGSDGRGCHVFRRLDGEEPRRLTSTPLSVAAGELRFVDDSPDLTDGASLHYWYAVLGDDKEIARSDEVEVTWQVLPRLTVLRPASPNPFNALTRLSFDLARSGPVRLRLYDLAGRHVATLVDGEMPAGRHNVEWRGRDHSGRSVASGAYIAVLEADGKVMRQKLTLLK